MFAHVKSLPDLAGGLFSHVDPQSVAAVGVSTRPRAVDGSYMPCFLAGVCLAKTVASLLRVPLVEVSHQQGHLAAALWSSGREALLDRPFLAWHLSGGTTELLYVEPQGAERGLQPDRRHHRHFCRSAHRPDRPAFGTAVPGGQGPGPAEPGGRAGGGIPGEVPGAGVFPFRCGKSGASSTLPGLAAGRKRRRLPWTVFAGPYTPPPITPGGGIRGFRWCFPGVWPPMPSLRRQMEPFDPVFCPPQYATDNAMGVAVLAWRSLEESDGTTDL